MVLIGQLGNQSGLSIRIHMPGCLKKISFIFIGMNCENSHIISKPKRNNFHIFQMTLNSNKKSGIDMTLNLPPLEEISDPEYETNCLNWRNWLAFGLAVGIIGLAGWLALYQDKWCANKMDWFMPIELDQLPKK